MILQIVIDSTDRTSLIEWKSVRKRDQDTERVDTFAFSYKKFGSRTWTPEREDEIIVTDTSTSTRVFAGRIQEVKASLKRNGTVEYDVKCKDYTVDFDDELLTKTYENQTIQQIIDDFKPAGFTSTNVSGSTIVDRIQFNYQKKSDCLKDLAELVNYHFYIDYFKDIHFFAKSGESAPFNLTDSSTNLVGDSLRIDVDNTQMRNRIYVLGGETVGASRTESYEADGAQDFFPLANKFSEKPTVELNSTAQTVGVAPLEDFTDGPYQVLWNFNEKYIQFDTVPTAADDVDITGTPLADVAVIVEDSASIAQYGVREFRIEDKNIKDSDTARQRGAAEMDAYAQGISSGGFKTYTTGLRAGQTITINSALLGVNEAFIIKSVDMRLIGPEKPVYSVKLVSHRIVEVIEFLQNLLRDKDKLQARAEGATLTIIKSTAATINVKEEIGLDAEQTDHQTVNVAEQVRKDPFGAGVVTPVFADYFPTNDSDPKRPARFNRNARYQ